MIFCHPTLGQTAVPGLPDAQRCSVLSSLGAGHDRNQGELGVRDWRLCAQLPVDRQDLVQLCSFSSPSTQPPQSSSRGFAQALPQQLHAAPCCPPSCQPREQPGFGGCRARKAFAMHCGAVRAVFALAGSAKCRVRPRHQVAIFTKDIKLYASPISQPGFTLRAQVHLCSSPPFLNFCVHQIRG